MRTKRWVQLVGVVAAAAGLTLVAGCSDSSDSAEPTASASATDSASVSASATASATRTGEVVDGGPGRPSVTRPPTPKAADLPSGLEPVTAKTLVGLWVPLELPPDATQGASFLDVDDDGSFVASDGCNATFGAWTVGGGGALAVESGPSTLIACPGAPVPAWFATATAAGLDKDRKLVLVGEDGKQHRLERGKPRAIPTGPDGQTS